MKSGRTVIYVLVFICSTLFCLAHASPPHARSSRASRELLPGLVVAKVRPNSLAEKAGFQVGDVILAWKRGNVGGPIGSPFDLLEIQVEQKALGIIQLEGFRGGEHKVWTMGRGFWDLHVQPNFPDDFLSSFVATAAQAESEKPAEIAARWQTFISESRSFRCSWLAPWLLSRAAISVAQKREWQLSDNLYRRAAKESVSAGPGATARVLHQWAETFEERSDWKNAEKFYRQALEKSREANPESLAVAASLWSLGDLARHRGDLAEAEEFHRTALPLTTKLAPDSLAVAQNLNKIGTDAFLRGHLVQAGELHRQALAIEEKLDPEGLSAAGTLAFLGHVALKQDHLVEAENDYQRSLAIQEKLAPDTLDIAHLLDNLGVLALERSDLVTAEKYHRRALAIEERQEHDGLHLATTLNNLGLVAKDRGDLDEAEKYQRRALAIREKLAPDSLPVAASLDHLGALVSAQGNLQAAKAYLDRSLAIRETLAPDSLEVAVTLNDLGDVANQCGELDQAEQYYRRALIIVEKNAPQSLYEADNLNPLGDLAFKRENLASAEELYHRALKIRSHLAPGSQGHANTLASLASVMQKKGAWDAAARFFEQSINALESQTSRLGGTPENLSMFRANHSICYTGYVDLLMEQRKPELAFQVLERFRARSLVEMLAEGGIDIRKGADSALLQVEQLLRRALDSKSSERIRLLSGKSSEAAAALNHEIADLLVRYQQVEQQIKQSSPGYAALTQPQALSVKDVQQQLLDNNTLLLEYYLGENHSYVWVISSSSVGAYELPQRAVIDETARNLYSLLTARNDTIKGETQRAQQERWAAAEAQSSLIAAKLSSMVLGPIAGNLGDKRLLIVSDGTLQYIPFALLPLPASPAATEEEKARPLMATHEIMNLPSASVLGILQRETLGRRSAPKELAVLADPVFDQDDARVKTGSRASRFPNRTPAETPAPRLTDQLTRSARDIGLNADGKFHLARLPFTREEAQTILAYTHAGEGMQALDFKASRQTVSSEELSQYRIVHFATHAIIDNLHPELSGLVLSLVDELGRPVNGFLDLQEIYNLNLPADLVVLSACSTGLGKEIRGEGMVGLTRGFMYAGAARVMASLWHVDDVATAKLMGAFYKAMEQEGLKPAAALRKAQMEMLHQKNWSSPYYWAGFQLQGEW